MFLLVTKTGGKRWRLKYRFEGKERVLALGIYPGLPLSDARKIANAHRIDIANGINPAAVRKANKVTTKANDEIVINTFKKVATDYLTQRNELNEDYKTRLENAFNNDVYPFIKDTPITAITPKDIIEIVKRVEKRGAVESAHRLFTQISRVFKYAVSNQMAERNPCNDMDKNMILQSPVKKNYPTITDNNTIQALLSSIDEYSGD